MQENVKYQKNIDRGIVVSESKKDILYRNLFTIDHGYPVAMVDGKKQYLHALIMNIKRKKGFEIDHVNGNKLDNRTENLRYISHRGNTSNTVLSKRNTTGHKGVIFDTRIQKWVARIVSCGKSIHLGSFADIGDAIRIRKDAEDRYFSPLWAHNK